MSHATVGGTQALDNRPQRQVSFFGKFSQRTMGLLVKQWDSSQLSLNRALDARDDYQVLV